MFQAPTVTVPSTSTEIGPSSSKPVATTHSRTKEGCWTCRIRQKKCDLERGPNDECATCTRLKLKCRGWGANRPEWMKDKALVKQAREEIKLQLLSQGMVRGINRSTVSSSSIPSFASESSDRHRYDDHMKEEVSKSQSTIPLVSVPSHSSAASASWMSPDQESLMPRHELSDRKGISPTESTNMIPHTQVHDPGESGIYHTGEGPKGIGVDSDPALLAYTSDANPKEFSTYDSTFDVQLSDNVPNPMELDMPFSSNDVSNLTDYPITSAVAASYNTAIPKNAEWDVYFPRLITPSQPQRRSAPQEDLIFFYFSRVLPRQFYFEKQAVDSTVGLLQLDSTGILSNSLSILSSFLDSRMRAAEGLSDLFETRTPNSYLMYRNRVVQQIQERRDSGANFTIADAAACLHIASWLIFNGGSARWADILSVPLAWFEHESGIPTSNSPQLAIQQLSPPERFVMSCTFWMDIYIGITYLRPPHLLPLYRDLLRARVCYGGIDEPPILSGTNGSCDITMLSLAEIVDFECWKHAQLMTRTLEPHEVHRRHEEIHFGLQAAALSLTHHMNAAGINPDQPPSNITNEAISDRERRLLTSDVQLRAAYLYLSFVMHGYDPNVLENQMAMGAAMNALLKLPPSGVDRLLLFPILLLGCVADDPLQRHYLADRLRAQVAPFGNLEEVLKLMHAIWARRDETGQPVEWRAVMKDLGMELLLI